MLFCLILVRMLTGASVHHDVCRDRVERHARQMMNAHGASDEQDRDIEPPLIDIYRIDGTRMKEKEGPTALEVFFSLVLLLFLLCNPRFPIVYKRGSRTPYGGGRKEKTQEEQKSTT